MPKRTGYLWDEICSIDNLFSAYKATIKGRRFKPALLRYSRNLDENLLSLRSSLLSLTWTPHITFTKEIFYPKYRVITAPIPYDRVAFHAIVDVIRPYFERKFIYHSYACRVGKGTYAAVKSVQKMAHSIVLQHEDCYILKCDIHSYFASMDHAIIKALVRRTIKDPNVLIMLDRIVDSAPGDKGLPLGSLSSQLFANIYLDYLDHKIKDELKVRYYVRYMDDFVVLHWDKRYLRNLLSVIKRIVENELKLELNPKTDIFPIKHGVDFCGYRIFPTYLLPRKRNIQAARRRLKKLAKDVNEGLVEPEKFTRSMASYVGYVKHCKGYLSMGKILEECVIRGGKRNLDFTE